MKNIFDLFNRHKKNLMPFIITERMNNITRVLIDNNFKPIIVIAIGDNTEPTEGVKVLSLDALTNAEMIILFQESIKALETLNFSSTQLELEQKLRQARNNNKGQLEQ